MSAPAKPLPQSVLDALADAEQLARFLHEHPRTKVARQYFDCANLGYRTLDAIHARNTDSADAVVASAGALYAARAAFRAIPGLRA